MDEIKKAELRGIWNMLATMVPQAPSFDEIEQSAKNYDADLRSFLAGYCAGAKDGLNFGKTQKPITYSKPTCNKNDITNLWGLLP